MTIDQAEDGPNPFAVTTTDLPPPMPGRRRPMSVGAIMVWLLLIPAMVSNALLWGSIGLQAWLPSAIQSSDGLVILAWIFLGIPMLGGIYGVVVGMLLYRASGYRYLLVHPVAQFFFQPAWFFFTMTAGCFAAILGRVF
jgi:hypothetical protein